MKRSKAYLYFWIWIPFVLLYGWLQNTGLDVNLHDTYFVVNGFQFASFVSFSLFISGLGYYIFRTGVLKTLERIHLGASFGGFACILVLWFAQVQLINTTQKGNFVEYQAIEYFVWIHVGQLISIVLVFIGFLVYVTNMVLTIIKRKTKR